MWVPSAVEVVYFNLLGFNYTISICRFLCKGLLAVRWCTWGFSVKQLIPLGLHQRTRRTIIQRLTITAKVQIFLLKSFEKRKSLLLCWNFSFSILKLKKDSKSLRNCRNVRIGAIQRKKACTIAGLPQPQSLLLVKASSNSKHTNIRKTAYGLHPSHSPKLSKND